MVSFYIQQSIERDEEAVVPGSNSIEEPILAKPLNPKPQAVVAKPPTQPYPTTTTRFDAISKFIARK